MKGDRRGDWLKRGFPYFIYEIVPYRCSSGDVGPRARLAPVPDWEIRCFRHLSDWLHFPIGVLSVLSSEPDCQGIPIDVFSRLVRIPD